MRASDAFGDGGFTLGSSKAHGCISS